MVDLMTLSSSSGTCRTSRDRTERGGNTAGSSTCAEGCQPSQPAPLAQPRLSVEVLHPCHDVVGEPATLSDDSGTVDHGERVVSDLLRAVHQVGQRCDLATLGAAVLADAVDAGDDQDASHGEPGGPCCGAHSAPPTYSTASAMSVHWTVVAAASRPVRAWRGRPTR